MPATPDPATAVAASATSKQSTSITRESAMLAASLATNRASAAAPGQSDHRRALRPLRRDQQDPNDRQQHEGRRGGDGHQRQQRAVVRVAEMHIRDHDATCEYGDRQQQPETGASVGHRAQLDLGQPREAWLRIALARRQRSVQNGSSGAHRAASTAWAGGASLPAVRSKNNCSRSWPRMARGG